MRVRTDKIQKVCSCGTVYTQIPAEAKDWVSDGQLIGWTWVCKGFLKNGQTCNSNPFIPTFDLKRKEVA